MLLGTAVPALLAMPGIAMAQTLEGDGSTEIGESDDSAAEPAAIVVTGSRIPRPDLESNSPNLIVDSEEIRYQGATTVEGVLNRLPQFTPDANENVSNGSNGTANINLRGLGSNRLLTLINGQRMLPQQAVDVNFVPSSLVERIDVVTGGASAVYGSDAMSGVVNFILRDDLDGVRMDGQISVAQHRNDNEALRDLVRRSGYEVAPRTVVDGGKQDINLSVGKNFAEGRGNITLYGGYRNFSPIVQSNRDVSACAVQAADDKGSAFTCGGSSNTPFGAISPTTGPNAGRSLVNSADGSRTFVPFTPAYNYNYAPDNFFQRADERITAGGFAHFEIVPQAEIYGSVMYMRDRSLSQVAPSSIWLGTNFAIPCNNPLASQQQLDVLCGAAAGTDEIANALIGYRLTGSPRLGDLRHDDYRYNAGMRGDLGGGFAYDVGYLRSLVRFEDFYLNDVNQTRAAYGLDVIPVNGVPTCRAVVDGTDPDCVPIDVFRFGGITQDQREYLFQPRRTFYRNTQRVLNATLTADLGRQGLTLPWTDRGIGLALGAERRRETLDVTVDEIARQQGIFDSDGVIEVTEGYGEIEIPLVADKPFLRELTVNGGVRFSSYDNSQASTGFTSSFDVWTYKGELSWQPVADLRLRASYNRAIRAPNIDELFGQQLPGNVTATDPCAGRTPSLSLEACQRTGVTAERYGRIVQCPANTCSALFGGNRELRPEKADTYTVGLVLQPGWLRRSTLTVDYFNIRIDDYIGSIDPSLTIDQCVKTGNPFFCSLFNRDPRTGTIFGTDGYVRSTTINTGYLQTSGIDVVASYVADLGAAGDLAFDLAGTYLIEQVTEPVPGQDTYDCKGLFGYTCGQPVPEWKHLARLTYQAPGETNVSVAWRHIAGTRLSSNSINTGSPSIMNDRIDAYDYFDLTLTQGVADKLQLRAGVTNVFDRSPPVISTAILAAFGNGNTYPGVYDPVGRTLFVGATVEF